ncbi:MAG: hypothetical protein V1871_08630 [Planctomycetota bacterium]
MGKILKNNLWNPCPPKHWRRRVWLVLFIGLITTFNYGGCGGGGGSSGSSTPPVQSTPSVTTKTATDITQTTATLNGTINPNGVSTNVYFEYGRSIGYSSSTAPQNTGSGGTTPVTVIANITGLLPNTPYNFRIRATTVAGIAFNGANQTFTTTGLPPTCITNPSTNVTYNSAKLNGTVNPNGVATTVYFNYGLTTSYGNTTTPQPIGSETTNVPVNADISGLLSSTQYNFRIVGTNSNGTTYGNNLTFTTGAPYGSAPTVTTNPATNVTYNSVTLNGTVIPNGVTTNAYFNYGLTTSYGNTTTPQPIGSGISSVVVLAALSGLSSNMPYNFRVVGASSAGTTNGNNLTFTTAPPPPTCTTNAATNVTYNSARLNGTVNPNGYSTTAYFQYGITTSYSYGNTTTSQAIGSGTSNVNVTADITLLSGSTLYNFSVVGTNSFGTTYGNNLTFTTAAPPPPTCTTNPATNITSTSTTLNGTVIPNGSSTNAYFQWGTTASYGNTTTSQSIGSGTINVNVTADTSGLSASTQYNFRVVATNAGGTTNGLNQAFTTSAPPPPTCTTNAATNVTYNSATLNGTVNPNGLNVTSCYFQYGTTQSYGSQQNVTTLPGSGTNPISVTANVSSLSPTTTYNFRVVGTNSSGTTNGNNLTFTTGNLPGSPPSCGTNTATNVTYNSATLNGTVNPNGLATTAYFQWGLTTSYGSSTSSQTIGSGTININVTATLNGLSANTLYNFSVVATNSVGITYGTNQTFTTSAQPVAPTVTTNPAINVTSNSVTLNGTVNPNGATTTAYFQWGLTASYGSSTTSQSIGSGTSNVNITANISGLSANTLYNFRLVATNSAGITNGANQTFTTTTSGSTAVDDYCWVANFSSNNVTRIQKSTSITTTITVGNYPIGVAVDEVYCWVANYNSNNVSRIQKSDLSTTNIAVGNRPAGVAVDETYCWVANNGSNNVTRILKSNTAITDTITVGSSPSEVAVDGTYVWVANISSNNVTRIQKSDLSTITIAVGTGPYVVAVDETYCWVANYNDNTVTRIQKSTSITTTIAVGTGPEGVEVDETYCWVANSNSANVTRIQKSDLSTTTIAVGTTPWGVAVDATYCWVANYGDDTVTRITKSTSATTTIAVGTRPYSFGDMTGYAYDNYSRTTVSPPLPFLQEAYAKASNTGASDYFGNSVAISGDTMVVGANNESSNATGINGNQSDNSATNSGAAYVFIRSGTTWTQQAYIKASNTGASDYFGNSVAISGDTLVVGAYGESSNATGINGNQSDNSAINSGAVYVFTRSGTTWSQQAYIKASNTGAGDLFGWNVAISGDTMVVGANQEDSNATGINGIQTDNTVTDSGAAYVFVRSAGVWSQQAYIKASNTGINDSFSSSVAISGDTFVVGAYGESSNATGINGDQTNNSASQSGAAYVFTRSGTTWSQQAYIKASNTGAGDLFGGNVAISGDTIVVGAIWEASGTTGINSTPDDGVPDTGAAYVFTRSGTTWSQQAYIKASNTGPGDWFGNSVAISGDTLVVGALFERSNATGINGDQADNSATDSGAVYVFTRSGTTWSQQAYIKASNTGANDFFGNGVAISGGTIVVGANQEDSNATGINGNQADNSAANSGAVYVFR